MSQPKSTVLPCACERFITSLLPLLCLTLLTSLTLGQDGKPVQQSQPENKPVPGKDPGTLKIANTTTIRLHESVVIHAKGEVAQKIAEEWAKPFASRKIKLLLNGIEIPQVDPISPVWIEDNTTLELQFVLLRHPELPASRAAWDLLLDNTPRDNLIYKLSVALAVGDHLPRQVSGEMDFNVNYAWRVRSTIFVASVLLVGLLVGLGYNSNMLRDGSQPNAPFSLGRTQMAFWGLLVFCGWVGTSFITGAMEQVPTEVLTLIGISASTGLGALAISNSHDIGKQQRASTIVQRNALAQAMNATGYVPTQADKDKLTQMNDLIATFPAAPAPIPSPTNKFAGFFHDLCSDENGLSFHRLQIVLWTIGFGSFFIWRVTDILSFPVIPQNLLILMGISSGTYLGFKIPEKS